MGYDAADFPNLLQQLRSRTGDNPELNDAEKHALIASLNYGEAVFAQFLAGKAVGPSGKAEPPLSRHECADLMTFVLEFAKCGSGPTRVELKLSPTTRTYVAAFYMVLQLLEQKKPRLVFVSPDEASSRSAREYREKSPALAGLGACQFVTWDQAATLPLEGACFVGDVNFRGIDPGRRDSALRTIKRLEGISSSDLILLDQDGPRVGPRPAGCLGMLLAFVSVAARLGLSVSRSDGT